MIGSADLDWQGRQLVEWVDDYYRTTYTYNADGIRTSKEVYEFGVSYVTRTEYMLSGSQIIKIGTATPPPGISVESVPMAVEKLSLRRGEVLILVSDGVQEAFADNFPKGSVDAPLGELAMKILEQGSARGEDDATAVLIRLRPVCLPTS